jgi:hypothetical protein
MTLAFLASRKGYLKVMGCLIQAALDRGHRVVLLRDPGQEKPGEKTTPADFEWWPRAELADYPWGAPLLPVLEAQGIRDLVGPSLYLVLKGMKRLEEVPDLKRRGIRFYSVDYGFETATSDPEGYRVIDVTFYQSEFQRSKVHWQEPRFKDWDGDFAVLRREKVDLESRSYVSGSTMLDQRALVRDPAAVRRNYKIAADRPVVLFMSMKIDVERQTLLGDRRLLWGWGPAPARAAMALAVGRARLVREIMAGNPYRGLADAVHAFCRRSGAALVVKSREKNRDPGFIRDMADVLVERDDEVFPYSSIQLMAIADLCIHFQSGAVLEAASCGVPSLSVKVPPPFPRDNPAFEELWDAKPRSFQNWEGIVWSADLHGAARLLADRKLHDFAVQPEARRDYVERYVGFGDTRSSERVLDVIERQAAREG